MGPFEFDILDDVSSTDPSWSDWKSLVEEEGWTSDDRSVLELTPLLDSTRTVIAKDKAGKWLGSVVWNEYDNVAFIGFYILRPEARGKGVGSQIWKRAISRMPQNYTIALRAVEKMAAKYQSMDTPVVGPDVNRYTVEWEKMNGIIEPYVKKDARLKFVKNMTKEEYHQLEVFDQKVTKRKRQDFLRRYHDLPYTVGCCLYDENNEIAAVASIGPTGKAEQHMFKISPIYASTLEDAFTVIQPLVKHASQYKDAQLLFHVMVGSKGEEELVPIFEANNMKKALCGTTLYSKNFENILDMSMTFIPNNNSGHMDA